MPTLRESRRLKAHASARLQKARAYSEHMNALHALEDEFDHDDHDDRFGRVCPACDGDGGDRYSDYLFECEHCGGTGREEW
jgi:hypothetical protein